MNRVAVITGGSRGIGRAVAFALAKRGYKVCIGYRSNEKAADELSSSIEVAGGMAAAVRCDVGSEADILSLFKKADLLGPLGVLVNNAGIVAPSIRLDEMSTERFQRMMSVNVVGSLICAREAVRRMSTRHGGNGRRHRQPVIDGRDTRRAEHLYRLCRVEGRDRHHDDRARPRSRE